MADESAADLKKKNDELTKQVATMKDRLEELERLLAPPPQDSPVVTVTYSDGRVKYAASNGDKFTLPRDAMHRSQVLALIATGLTETAAERVMEVSDNVMRILTTPPSP